MAVALALPAACVDHRKAKAPKFSGRGVADTSSLSTLNDLGLIITL